MSFISVSSISFSGMTTIGLISPVSIGVFTYLLLISPISLFSISNFNLVSLKILIISSSSTGEDHLLSNLQNFLYSSIYFANTTIAPINHTTIANFPIIESKSNLVSSFFESSFTVVASLL